MTLHIRATYLIEQGFERRSHSSNDLLIEVTVFAVENRG
jgi:hypothetical protein